ncbi:MAG TPA: DUF2520 domain-containing protein [Bryobacteraceae bacterium]|nr:DUF2520 domain-containing protein [Bryobacteraceae bacterium]
MPKTSRGSEFRFKYGVAAAGAVSQSLIGQLPPRSLGPVCAVSYRVASRIANTLGGTSPESGAYPVRSAAELNGAPAILFHAPPDQITGVLDWLESAAVEWTDKPVIFCDCVPGESVIARFHARGASVAMASRFEVPGYLLVEGSPLAVTAGHRIARELRMKAIEIAPGCRNIFDAAITLSTGALTPLIDTAADFLRDAGVRDADAPRLAASLFQETALSYAHSGKQSWRWYVKEPEKERIEAQIEGAGPEAGPVLRRILLYGFDLFDKHAAIAGGLRQDAPKNTKARPDKAGLR